MAAKDGQSLSVVAEAPASEKYGRAHTVGSISYARRASSEDVARFAAEAKLGSQGKAPSGGQNGAGRFFRNPQMMPVYSLRGADTNIDREGVLVLQKPGGEDAWAFSDALQEVLDPKAVALRRDYYPELEQFILKNVVTADGRRPKYAVCAASQIFTEDKSRGYTGSYARSAHSDVFEIRPEVDDLHSGFWDPVGWDATAMSTGNFKHSSAPTPYPQYRHRVQAAERPLIHPYAGMVFGGGHSSASRWAMRGKQPPHGTSTIDGPENLLLSKGISVEEARGMDLMMINAWRPFSWPVADNPLAVLDCTSINAAEDYYRIPDGVPMTAGEPPQRITHNPGHRWLYVPDMRPDEVLVFKQGDSRVGTEQDTGGLSRFGFHTAFRLPGDPGGEHGHRSRRSIASRLLLLFERAPPCAKL